MIKYFSSGDNNLIKDYFLETLRLHDVYEINCFADIISEGDGDVVTSKVHLHTRVNKTIYTYQLK